MCTPMGDESITKRRYIHSVSGCTPHIPNPNLSERRRVRHTDWWDTLPSRPISLPPARCFLSLSWPLVYWHHQLNKTSSNICSANDCVVKSINLRAARTPREMLRKSLKVNSKVAAGKFPTRHSQFLAKPNLQSYFCRINTHHIQPAVLPTTINNAINEHNDDSTRRTFLFAHHAFRSACYYKWPNTPYNSTSFSRCPSLAWLPTYSTLAIKISVIEHINYTHPETAMITISHVWMDYSHLPQNCRGRAMTLVKREEGGGRS